MLYCMWRGGPSKREDCFKDATILIDASCKNGCWSNKKVFACEEHTTKVREMVATKNPDSYCGKCKGPVEVNRITSV